MRIGIILSAFMMSVVIFGCIFTITSDKITSTSCPDGTDIIDDDVCVDSIGNYFPATKQQESIENRVAYSFLLLVFGFMASCFVYISGD